MQGSYTELCRHIPILCRPGTILLHDAGETHADYFLEPARLMNIEAGAAINGQQTAMTLIEQLAAADGCPRAVSHVLRGALRLLNTRLDGGRHPAWLSEAIRRLERSDADDMPSVAAAAGVHPTHFARSFRVHVGMTPSAYRARQRVRRASNLLLSTGRRISTIALECGFSDQSHLTRVFCGVAGISPGAFRAVFSR